MEDTEHPYVRPAVFYDANGGFICRCSRSHTSPTKLRTQGKGDGRGGTYSGDSGGPVFLGDFTSNLIVAVTSFGKNSVCGGTDFSYRIDTVAVLRWINSIN